VHPKDHANVRLACLRTLAGCATKRDKLTAWLLHPNPMLAFAPAIRAIATFRKDAFRGLPLVVIKTEGKASNYAASGKP